MPSARRGAIVEHALAPALATAGLPAGTVQLIDEPARSGGHALVRRPPTGAGGRPRFGCGRRRTRRRGRAGRYAGEPARNGGCMDDRRRARRPRRRARRRRQLARSQGVQHAQRLRHPRVPGRHGAGLPRCVGERGRGSRRRCAAPRGRRVRALAAGRLPRATRRRRPRRRSERRAVRLDDRRVRTGHRVGVGALAGAHPRRDVRMWPTPSLSATATAPTSSRR